MSHFDTGERPLVRSASGRRELLRNLSERLVEAQRPLRLLPALRWEASIEHAFFAAGASALPPITPTYYSERPLAFEPRAKTAELRALATTVREQLGLDDPGGWLLHQRCLEYQQVVDLLCARGTAHFSELSRRLFGSARDAVLPTNLPLDHLANWLTPTVSAPNAEAVFSAEEAAEWLAERWRGVFHSQTPRVRIQEGLAANAVAGSRTIRLRRGAHFTSRELAMLEVHEGWVHLGTTLMGREQPVCRFLAHGTPSTIKTQEGLAVLTECLAGVLHPGRWRRLLHRVQGVALAERGANFLEVYRFFLDQGYEPRESYPLAVRIFRGSLPTGGAFTKDVVYLHGLFEVFHAMRSALRMGQFLPVQLLFCGKTSLHELSALVALHEDGLLPLPTWLPPPYRAFRREPWASMKAA